MNDIQKSMVLFLFGCIPTRLGFVWLAYNKLEWLNVMAIVATVIAVGFSVIYLFKLRETGGEVFGNKIWWNDLRPIHAVLYATFAYLAINDPQNAWKLLAIDVTIGFFAFLVKRVLI